MRLRCYQQNETDEREQNTQKTRYFYLKGILRVKPFIFKRTESREKNVKKYETNTNGDMVKITNDKSEK